ncbi:ABC transporter substrate-binding protein [Rhodococcus erythropolis]
MSSRLKPDSSIGQFYWLATCSRIHEVGALECGRATEDAIGDAEVVYLYSDSEPNFEKVAGLAPDLIVGVSAGFDENTYAKLTKIAPTVGRPIARLVIVQSSARINCR